MRNALVAVVLCVATSAIVRAAPLSPVGLATEVNSDLTTYAGGGSYPQNGGPLTVDAIDFTLSTIGPEAHTAIVQTSTSGGEAETYVIPVNRKGATVAYTLVNSAFGVCGTVVGEIDFIGAANTYTYTLTEGTNIRDHYNDGYCNTVTDVAGSAIFDSDRLDMQQIALPAGFANDTLLRIEFRSNGAGAGGAPFLAAVTMDGTPAPLQATVAVPALGKRLVVALAMIILLSGIGLAQRAGCAAGRPRPRL